MTVVKEIEDSIIKNIPIITKTDILNYNIKFYNTEYLREPARHFTQHGRYTFAEKGTQEYVQYWAKQEEYCRDGYWLGGLWIPGEYYFYLNFFKIEATPDALYLKYNPRASKSRKIKRFATVWEIDYLWFLSEKLCEQNMDNLIPEVNLVVGKTRRIGFSYKKTAKGAYNFTFLHGSSTKYFAAEEAYITSGNGIFNKVIESLDFINANTGWSQLRQKGDSNLMKKAQFFDQSGTTSYGHKSTLIADWIKDPEKVRGGDSLEVVLEEGGSFPKLLTILNSLVPTLKEGIRYTGRFTLFGTGTQSENDKYIAGLDYVFHNPLEFDCLALPNIWEMADDDGYVSDDLVGIFVPTYYTMEHCRDKDGNLNIEKAKEEVKKERSRKSGEVLAGWKIEFPIKPSEMFNKVFSSIIPKELKELASKRKTRLLKDTKLRQDWKVGLFHKIDNTLNFIESGEHYTAFPHPIGKLTERIESSICMYQTPYKEYSIDYPKGRVPEDMYGITLDPVDKDIALTSNSIISVHVYKKDRTQLRDRREKKLIVASFCGRWNPRLDFHKQIFYLAEYYNAKIQLEIQGGGSDVIRDAKLLRYNIFDMFESELTAKKSVDKTKITFGTTISSGNKGEYMLSLIELLGEVVGYSDFSQEVVRVIDTIDDIGLLEEIIKHKNELNVDRISSAQLIKEQLNQKEIEDIEESEKGKPLEDPFFSRNFY